MRLSRGSLPVIMMLTVGSHVVGMAAVYTQYVYLYGLTLIMNVLNGIATFAFHTAMDSNVAPTLPHPSSLQTLMKDALTDPRLRREGLRESQRPLQGGLRGKSDLLSNSIGVCKEFEF